MIKEEKTRKDLNLDRENSWISIFGILRFYSFFFFQKKQNGHFEIEEVTSCSKKPTWFLRIFSKTLPSFLSPFTTAKSISSGTILPSCFTISPPTLVLQTFTLEFLISSYPIQNGSPRNFFGFKEKHSFLCTLWNLWKFKRKRNRIRTTIY